MAFKAVAACICNVTKSIAIEPKSWHDRQTRPLIVSNCLAKLAAAEALGSSKYVSQLLTVVANTLNGPTYPKGATSLTRVRP